MINAAGAFQRIITRILNEDALVGRSKIKNTKGQNWRLELSSYHFDIVYRPGSLNYAADALTRNSKTKTKVGLINSMSLKENLLTKLHKELGCPGITRLF